MISKFSLLWFLSSTFVAVILYAVSHFIGPCCHGPVCIFSWHMSRGRGGGGQKRLRALKSKSSLHENWKGTFEIPHKISYLHIERCVFHLEVEIWELLDLRVRKRFEPEPPPPTLALITDARFMGMGSLDMTEYWFVLVFNYSVLPNGCLHCSSL